MSARQHAELTKEERAAIGAGLREGLFGIDQGGVAVFGREVLELGS